LVWLQYEVVRALANIGEKGTMNDELIKGDVLDAFLLNARTHEPPQGFTQAIYGLKNLASHPSTFKMVSERNGIEILKFAIRNDVGLIRVPAFQAFREFARNESNLDELNKTGVLKNFD